MPPSFGKIELIDQLQPNIIELAVVKYHRQLQLHHFQFHLKSRTPNPPSTEFKFLIAVIVNNLICEWLLALFVFLQDFWLAPISVLTQVSIALPNSFNIKTLQFLLKLTTDFCCN